MLPFAHNRSPSLCLIIALGGALHSAGSLAQPSDEAANVLEEVIVTAQKREQRLMDVAMAVSAITDQEIRDRLVTSIEGLQFSVPGLSMWEYGPGQQHAQIRGISASTGLPTIGRYVDEVPVNVDYVGGGQDVRLIDMARVEVLRGPQGTLYGEGSMGGTIKYVTASPELDRFGFDIEGGYNSVSSGGDGWLGNAVINVPVVEDEFGLRFVAFYEEFPGWVDNPTRGLQDANGGDITGFRGKALWTPTERFRAELLLMNQELDLDANNYSDQNGETFVPLGTPIHNEYDLANLVLEYEFDGFSVLSSTGYLDRNDASQVDVTAFFVPLLEAPPPFGLGFPPGTFSAAGITSNSETEIFTQEIRFASLGDGPWTWTAGAYYRNYDGYGQADSFTVPDILPFEILASEGSSPSDSESWALFGEMTYAFSERLQATFGLRYFEDDRTQDVSSVNFGAPSIDQQSASFDTTNPRFNIQYRISDDSMVYFNAAKGFRSGGFNLTSAGLGIFEIPPTYDPEELWTYEVGSKNIFLDGRLSLEAAVYYNDWTDMQVSEFAPGSPIIVTVNGGEASGWGADFVLSARPTDQLSLSLTAGYIDAEFESDTAARLDGDPLDYVPELTWSASAMYEFAWTEQLPGVARLDYQYRDPFDIVLRNFANSVVRSDSLGFLNASVGIEKENWQLYLEGKNLLDEDGVVFPAVGVSLVPVRPQPLSVGVRFRYQYR